MERLRAVAACRCSTEEESQKDALMQQVKEAKACIADMGWLLVDTYVEAKSGTTVKGRKEYNRLFEDLDKDNFDIGIQKTGISFWIKCRKTKSSFTCIWNASFTHLMMRL